MSTHSLRHVTYSAILDGFISRYNPSVGKLKETYWPEMNTPDAAEKAIRNAAGVAFVVAGVTALLSTLAMFNVLHFLQPWSIIDAILFAAIGFYIRRESRVAAVLGLVLYLLEALDRILSGAGGSLGGFSILTILFTLYLINGVRGAFSLARLRTRPQDGVPA